VCKFIPFLFLFLFVTVVVYRSCDFDLSQHFISAVKSFIGNDNDIKVALLFIAQSHIRAASMARVRCAPITVTRDTCNSINNSVNSDQHDHIVQQSTSNGSNSSGSNSSNSSGSSNSSSNEISDSNWMTDSVLDGRSLNKSKTTAASSVTHSNKSAVSEFLALEEVLKRWSRCCCCCPSLVVLLYLCFVFIIVPCTLGKTLYRLGSGPIRGAPSAALQNSMMQNSSHIDATLPPKSKSQVGSNPIASLSTKADAIIKKSNRTANTASNLSKSVMLSAALKSESTPSVTPSGGRFLSDEVWFKHTFMHVHT
jgi:hypothetical protein